MPYVPKFDPAVAALVVVDVQNDFCHPRGVMASKGADVGAAVAMAPRLARLVDHARQAAVPVVFIQTTHDDLTNTDAWLARHSPDLLSDEPPGSNCWTGTWGAELYEVLPEPGEPVVLKHRYSAFQGTSLDYVLRALGRRSLLLTGVSTNVCVESTLRDGLFLDYHVNLVEDCTASYDAAAHDATVRNVRAHFGLVTDSEALIAQWGSDDPALDPVAGSASLSR